MTRDVMTDAKVHSTDVKIKNSDDDSLAVILGCRLDFDFHIIDLPHSTTAGEDSRTSCLSSFD